MATLQQPENESEQLRFEKAKDYLDKLLINFPSYEKFSISNDIAKYRNNIDKNISNYRDEIEQLLIDEYEYVIQDVNEKRNCSLTELGREVKLAGGHLKYLEYLAKQKKDDDELQRGKEEKENQMFEETLTLTRLNIEQTKFEKKFGQKFRAIGAVISIITFVVTVSINLYLFKPDEESTSTNLNNKIDSLNILLQDMESRFVILEKELKADSTRGN
jgi:hypothetical protein